MPWNYRIVKTTQLDFDNKPEVFYGIHEAYYKRKNSKKPYAISIDPMTPYAETPEELKSNLDLMMKAFKQPFLNFEDFVKE